MGVYDEHLTRMADMRMAVGMRYKWYVHLAKAARISNIVADGLQPLKDTGAPDIVKQYLGEDGANRICFNPLGTLLVPGPVEPGPYYLLALEREHLPRRIGLDWSYGGSYSSAGVYEKDFRGMSPEDIFLKSVHEYGCIISYDPVPPAHIRAFAVGSRAHNPLTWPPLNAVNEADLIKCN